MCVCVCDYYVAESSQQSERALMIIIVFFAITASTQGSHGLVSAELAEFLDSLVWIGGVRVLC